MAQIESSAVRAWKEYTMNAVQLRFGNSVNMTTVSKYLDRLIAKEMRSPRCYFINNLKRQVLQTDMLTIFNLIDQESLITGGGSVLFVPHDRIPNPFLDFIVDLKKKRSSEKSLRDTFERGVDEMWNVMNNKQNNTKVVTNSLYGVLGYAKFIFYNPFLAASITRMGRIIISTAACGFENFLCGNIQFSTPSELYEYITTVIMEYKEKYEGKMDFSILETEVSVKDVVGVLCNKCHFPIPVDVVNHITSIVSRLTPDARLLLYYKNNFFQFNRIPRIKEKIMHIISNIDQLRLPSLDKIEREDIRDEVQDLWNFYDCFVFYNHPIFDSVRKMAYGSREAVLYIDTDSNFIALNRWVHQIRKEFFHDQYHQDPKEFIFICANIITIFLSIVVDRNLKMLARNCNIEEDWVKWLSMKNEFFFWRILFGDVKKRYCDLQMIQEGKLLKDGEGILEIKGYDFRKNVTKKSVRDFYSELCLNDILRPDEIDMRSILQKIDHLRKEVRRSMLAGESMYFKQANVNPPEHYATPLRLAGIKGVMLWNVLCPEYAIELPADVDIIPIRNISSKKGREYFAEKYPDLYARLDREIFNNRNPNIKAMTLNVVAKPKNANIPMPAWLLDVMDTERIVNSTIKLIIPIMESLGIKIQKPTKNRQYLTNIVDL